MRPPLLAAALLLAACADDAPATAEATPPQSVEPPADSAETAPDARPATDTAVVMIEGGPEEIALRLVRFDDLSLPFSTYVPDTWEDDWTASGEGEAAILTMGTPPLQGVVQVFIPSASNRDGLAAMAEAVAESRGETFPVEGLAPWASNGVAFAGIDEAGRVQVGEHAGVPFYVLESYPVEMGDGFPPRAEVVLDRLRWSNDGTGL